MGDRSTARRALLGLFVVTLIWGGTFVWMKEATNASEALLGEAGERSSVALFLLLRFGLAALLLPLVPAVRRELGGPIWFSGGVLALLLCAGFVLQMTGLQGVSPPVSAFLTSLYVVFTAILVLPFKKRGMGRAGWFGVAMATLGAAFISGPPQLQFDLPEWLTVGSAFTFALHILATDHLTRKYPPLGTTFACCVLTAGIAAVLLLGSHTIEGAPAWSATFALLREPDYLRPALLCATLGTALAVTLMNYYQRELPPVRAAILYALEPLWASVIALAAGLATADLWLLLGGGALLAGNLLAELRPRVGRPLSSSA